MISVAPPYVLTEPPVRYVPRWTREGASRLLLEDIELSTRAKKAVVAFGCLTAADIATLTERELLRSDNCGRKTVDFIKQSLGNHGLYLGQFAKPL